MKNNVYLTNQERFIIIDALFSYRYGINLDIARLEQDGNADKVEGLKADIESINQLLEVLHG